LDGSGANRFGIGAWISATTSEGSQVRELGGHNNYVSHNPYEVHFGLGEATEVDVEVRWPDGSITTRENIAADQLLTITQDSTNTRLVVNQGAGDGVYDPGTEVVVSAAEAQEGYHFSHWTSAGGGAFTDASLAETTFTMPDATVVVRANYLPGVAPTDDVSVARRWNEVFMDEVRVPKKYVIGEVNRGWYAAMTVLNFERTSVDGAARHIGSFDRFIEMARKLKMNGVNVLEDPVTKSQLADLRVVLEVDRMLAYRVAAMQAAGEIPQYEGAMSGWRVLHTSKYWMWNTFAKILGPYAALLKGERRAPGDGMYGTNYMLSQNESGGGGGIALGANIIAQRGLGLPR